MSDLARIALFPGTFDPITNGHLDLIRRARHLFDRLIVAIGENPEKRALFALDERLEMTRTLLADCERNVEVVTYTGLTVEYAVHAGATTILRGLRNLSDLNFEFQLALTNRAVANVETVFIMTAEQYAFTSSSLIKQIAACGNLNLLQHLLPPLVIERLRDKKQALGDHMLEVHATSLNE